MTYLVKVEGQPERELTREEMINFLTELVEAGACVMWFEKGKKKTVEKKEAVV